MENRIIPFDRKQLTQQKLIRAVGESLKEHGFKGLGVNKIAKTAGVDKVLVYRYFGGLPELIRAYSQTVDFWPSLDELLGSDPDHIKTLPPDQQVANVFKSFVAALRKRPATLDVLAWDLLERNEITRQFEDVRIRSFLEYFEHLADIPDDNNLSAIVVLMAGAVIHLLVKSRIASHFGGIDLESEKGWKQIDQGIDLLLKGIFET
jgi:AcrR family transcriptional regulator